MSEFGFRNTLANVALVLSILGLCGGLLSPLGLGLGAVALRRAEQQAGTGRLQAQAAMILALLGLLVASPLTLTAIYFSSWLGLG